MEIEIRPTVKADAASIIKILNYYIENSFSAYADEKVTIEYFDKLYYAAEQIAFFVAVHNKKVIGFGMMRPFREGDAFAQSAVITYFIMPEYTGHGLGKKFLELLEQEAKSKKVNNILAHISSKNEPSLKFHKKYGFTECGRFLRIGKKHGEEFDMVWMQKFI